MNQYAGCPFRFVAALAVLFCIPRAVPAAPVVLRLLPPDAYGFAHVRNPAEISTKFEAIGLELGVTLPSLMDVARSVTGIDEGYDSEKELVLGAASPAQAGQPPQPFAMVPVSDYSKFVESFLPPEQSDSSGVKEITVGGSQLLCAERSDYALLVDAGNRPLMDRLVSQAPRADPNLDALFGGMPDHDATVVVLQPGVQYALDTVIDSIEQLLERLETIGEDAPGQFEAGRGILSLYVDGLRVLRDETLLVAAGLSIDGQRNTTLVKRILLKTNGKMSRAFAARTSENDTSLARLVGEPFVLAAAFRLPPQWASSLADLSLRMLELSSEMYGIGELSDDDRRKLRDAYQDMMEGIESIAVALKPGQAGEPLYGNVQAVMRVRDASDYLRRYEKALAVWNRLWRSAGGVLKVTYEVERVEGVEIEGLKITFGMNADPLGEAGDQINAIFEKMFGPGGNLVSYLLKVDGHTCLWVVEPESKLSKAAERYRNNPQGLQRHPQLAQTSDMLAPEAAVTMYISPAGMMQFAQRAAKELANADLPMPSFPRCPPAGLSLAWDAGYLELRVAVPGELFRAVGEFAKQMRAGAAQR